MSATDVQEPPADRRRAADESLIQVINALMRFLVAVRYRWHVVLACWWRRPCWADCYYATATRYYSARASLLVMYTGFDEHPSALGGNGILRQDTTPTFESLATAPKVIEGALPYLQPEYCIDLAGTPQENWAKAIQRGLSAKRSRVRATLTITYRSKAPEVAVNVLNAVVQAYMEFLDKTNKGTVGS